MVGDYNLKTSTFPDLNFVHAANETWKSMRKASAQALSPEHIKKMGPYQFAEATQLMNDFLLSPDVRFPTAFTVDWI